MDYHKGQNRPFVMLQCDCRCCNLLVEKDVWGDGEETYNISVVDSYYKDQNSLLGRLRRAFGVLMGKSVPYNDVFIGEQSSFEGFVDELKALSEWKPEKTEAKEGSDA